MRWHPIKRIRGVFSRGQKKEKLGSGPGPQKHRELQGLAIELGRQSTYVPELVRIHNSLLKKPVFHPESNIPLITGIREKDEKIFSNSSEMKELVSQINDLRLRARRSHNDNEMHRMIDEARGLEAKFNDLKQENLVILMGHFRPEKKE